MRDANVVCRGKSVNETEEFSAGEKKVARKFLQARQMTANELVNSELEVNWSAECRFLITQSQRFMR